MTYDVYLQVDQEENLVYAHVPSLLGCNWHAETVDAALARAPAAITAHLAWLRRHGQAAPAESEPVAVRAIGPEPAAVDPAEAYLLPTDRQPLSPAEARRFLDLLACSRADLVALTCRLPDEVLDREPAPGAWPIRGILGHVANGELWLLRRIVAPEDVPAFEAGWSVWQRLERARSLVAEQLLAPSQAQLTQPVVAEGELWTARKVLRRLIEHELEHCAHVVQVLDALESARRGRQPSPTSRASRGTPRESDRG